jgi:hypothetical protein
MKAPVWWPTGPSSVMRPVVLPQPIFLTALRSPVHGDAVGAGVVDLEEVAEGDLPAPVEGRQRRDLALVRAR